ncbi:cytochrome P450 [Saccharothrix obliqua]|uniref:cytochrome P450 n=1 Tax=Saccharothrix obliqua TaxID=2861747 RepID=UPI001C5F5AE6|nr:cytochrome P450 [Saccharothrix obliqua]MBW4721555.1 cytochrome P450 [Saccharothrix obliqua]
MTSTAVDLDTVRRLLPFDPFDPGYQADPYPVYQRIRAERGQLFRMPGGMISVLGHRHCSQLLSDPRFGWGDDPAISDQFVPDPDGGAPHRPLLFMDPPDHTRVRRLVSKAFTPRTVERLRVKTELFAAELVAAAREKTVDGVVDLMDAVLRPLPGMVLSELMDIPVEYHSMFIALAKESGRGLDPGFTLSAEEKKLRDDARDQITAAGAGLAAARREKPGDDLVSLLALAESEGDRLTRMELELTLMNLLAAGFNASAAMMGNVILAILRHPDELAWLRAHPEQLAGATEELVRYDAPMQLVVRSALEEAEIGDVAVGPGDQFALLLGAGNRDPEEHTDPDRLDLTRPPKRNLGFGHGIHFCVAAPIGRMTAQVTLAALIRHDVELAVPEPLRAPGISMRTLAELPVALGGVR